MGPEALGLFNLLFFGRGGGYKEIDKKETRWRCGHFMISFEIFKRFGVDILTKETFSNCHESNVIHVNLWFIELPMQLKKQP